MSQHYEEDTEKLVTAMTARNRLLGLAGGLPEVEQDDVLPEVATRREMVAASEYKRMLTEAAMVEEMADNIMGLTKKLAARYQQILESVQVLASLGFSEEDAAGLAFRLGLITNSPHGGSQPTDSIECLRELRDALPETS